MAKMKFIKLHDIKGEYLECYQNINHIIFFQLGDIVKGPSEIKYGLRIHKEYRQLFLRSSGQSLDGYKEGDLIEYLIDLGTLKEFLTQERL